MLYRIAHILRDACPWLWNLIEWLNGILFALRYAGRLKSLPQLLDIYNKGGMPEGERGFGCDMHIEPLYRQNVPMAVSFFQRQPPSAFEFFKPHSFDAKSLMQLCRNKSFLAYLVMMEGEVVGYFFLRCFFTGKCFRGYMTDIRHRRMGINQLMGKCATDIAETLRLPMFGTISPKNIASMKSAQAVNDVLILKVLENGDYYVEFQKRKI